MRRNEIWKDRLTLGGMCFTFGVMTGLLLALWWRAAQIAQNALNEL